MSRLIPAALVAMALAAPGLAAEPTVVDVWPEGKIPDAAGAPGPDTVQRPRPDDAKPVLRLTDITRPTLSIHRPPKEKDTGAAVVIAPGGGYNILAWDLEGEEVAAWLNSIGVTGIILKYRVPRAPGEAANEPPPRPLKDAQRALSLVRSKAGEWGIDPRRIGMLGFSAGGNLTARAALGSDARSYAPIDAVDEVSCRPDFAVLVYPAYLEKDGALRPEYKVTSQSPPMFFAHAGDDRIRPHNSIALYTALHAAGVPAELHVYASGGHGFGLRPGEHPASTWPDRCAAWMKGQGLLKKGEAK
jgi:acetyl esterase/lipase